MADLSCEKCGQPMARVPDTSAHICKKCGTRAYTKDYKAYQDEHTRLIDQLIDLSQLMLMYVSGAVGLAICLWVGRDLLGKVNGTLRTIEALLPRADLSPARLADDEKLLMKNRRELDHFSKRLDQLEQDETRRKLLEKIVVCPDCGYGNSPLLALCRRCGRLLCDETRIY